MTHYQELPCLMKENIRTNLNQGRSKVQTAHDLVWKYQKKRLNPCIRLCDIRNFKENARYFLFNRSPRICLPFYSGRRLLRLGYVLT